MPPTLSSSSSIDIIVNKNNKLPFEMVQELTVSGDVNSRRNYCGIFISILVLSFISSVIVGSIFLANPDILKFSKLFQIKEKILLDEAIFGALTPKQWQVHWLEPNEDPRDRHDRRNHNQPSMVASNDPTLEPDILFFVDQDREMKLLSLPNEKGGAQFEPVTTNSNLMGHRPQEPVHYQTAASYSSKQQFAAKLPKSLEPQLNFSTLVSKSSLLMSQEYFDCKLSPSRRYILAASDKAKIYRHTYIANFYIYDIEQDKFTPLVINPPTRRNRPEQVSFDTAGGAKQEASTIDRFQYVTWAKVPNQSSGNYQDALVLVHDNDIYYMSSIKAKEIRLTESGQRGIVYNGIPDWLYEEELLFQDNAIEISPSGSRMAYMRFDDSSVDIMRIPYYGSVDEPLPQLLSIRYPKAGRVNPTVGVFVVDLTKGESLVSIPLRLPEDLQEVQHYIGSISWLSDNSLSLTWLNRDQNISYLLVCQQSESASGSPWVCKKNLLVESQAGWVDILDRIFPYDDNYYFALLPKYESDSLGFFKHIAKISIQTGQYTFLTSGQREVTEISGVDYDRGRVYYISTQEFKPDVRHFYWSPIDIHQIHPISIGFNSSASKSSREANCITCALYEEECQFNSIKLSPSSQYYVYGCLGPGVPKLQLRSIDEFRLKRSLPKTTTSDLNDATTTSDGVRSTTVQQQQLDHSFNDSNNINGVQQQNGEGLSKQDKRLLWTIEDNFELREKLKMKALPQVKRFTVPVGDGGQYNASVLMLLPPKIRDEDDQNVQYPMVVNVYAGPGSQRVDQRFDINYGHYLASNKKIIYTMIDGRGSGYQGSNLLYEIYKRFGSVEIEDQISVTKHLIATMPFIDKYKVAIWGWSYGGYAAAMALAQGSMPSGKSVTDRVPRNNNNIKLSNSQGTASRLSMAEHLHPEEVFECAISVAPVTNWIYYDTAYTERYMSSPYRNEGYDHKKAGDHLDVAGENGDGGLRVAPKSSYEPANMVKLTVTGPNQSTIATNEPNRDKEPNSGQHHNNGVSSTFLSSDLNSRYKKASLLDFVAHIDRKRFLLVHGTADDNVHFQQSIMLMKLLTSLNILYETQLYPDEDHAINYNAAKLHLYSTMNDFFGECFDIALTQDSLPYNMLNHKHRLD